MEHDLDETVGDRRIRAERRDGELERIIVEPAEPSASPEWAAVDARTRRRLGPAPVHRALASLRDRLPRPRREAEPPEAEPETEVPAEAPVASTGTQVATSVEVLRQRELAEVHATPLAPAWSEILNLGAADTVTSTAVPAIDRVQPEPGAEAPRDAEADVVPAPGEQAPLGEGEVPEAGALEHRVDEILASRLRGR